LVTGLLGFTSDGSQYISATNQSAGYGVQVSDVRTAKVLYQIPEALNSDSLFVVSPNERLKQEAVVPV
jgi:hypothetical protein